MSGKNPTLTSRKEQRAVIKHCVRIGMTPTDRCTFLTRHKSRPSYSRALVFRWHRRLSDGLEDVGDLKRSGRPSVVSERDVKCVREIMLQEDRRRTVREIGDTVQLKRTVVHSIMKEHLNLSKVRHGMRKTGMDRFSSNGLNANVSAYVQMESILKNFK